MCGLRGVCLVLAVPGLAACAPNLPRLPPNAAETATPHPHLPSAGLGEAGALDARRAILRPVADSLVERLNAERSAHGVPVLQISDTLTEIAFSRAEDMTVRGYLASHDPMTGQPLPLESMLDSGFGGRLAEVVAVVAPGLQDVSAITLGEWLASPAHRSVLLDPVYHYAGGGLMPDGQAWKLVLLLAERAPELR